MVLRWDRDIGPDTMKNRTDIVMLDAQWPTNIQLQVINHIEFYPPEHFLKVAFDLVLRIHNTGWPSTSNTTVPWFLLSLRILLDQGKFQVECLFDISFAD